MNRQCEEQQQNVVVYISLHNFSIRGGAGTVMGLGCDWKIGSMAVVGLRFVFLLKVTIEEQERAGLKYEEWMHSYIQ